MSRAVTFDKNKFSKFVPRRMCALDFDADDLDDSPIDILVNNRYENDPSATVSKETPAGNTSEDNISKNEKDAEFDNLGIIENDN